MKSHFDKEGFLFSLGFVLVVFFLVFTAKVYSEFYAEVYLSPEIYDARKNFTSVADLGEENKTLTLAFVGDIMLDRGVESKVMNVGAGDFAFPFRPSADELKGYDFLFGNLEGPLSDEGYDAGAGISFRMNVNAVAGLIYAGFDALSVANNHSGDWGSTAFFDTVANLEEAGIIPVGDNLEPKIADLGEVKLGIAAFTDFPGPGMRATDENIVESVKRANESADLVVASFHFGEEYKEEPSDRQRRIAQLAVDSGADLVIGHHSHVSQTLEKYKDAYIAYSLGNFVFDQYFSPETMSGSLLEVQIKDKLIEDVRLRKTQLNRDYQVDLN